MAEQLTPVPLLPTGLRPDPGFTAQHVEVSMAKERDT